MSKDYCEQCTGGYTEHEPFITTETHCGNCGNLFWDMETDESGEPIPNPNHQPHQQENNDEEN